MNTLDIEAFPKALRIRLEAEAARRGITLQELVMRYCSVGLEAAHYNRAQSAPVSVVYGEGCRRISEDTAQGTVRKGGK